MCLRNMIISFQQHSAIIYKIFINWFVMKILYMIAECCWNEINMLPRHIEKEEDELYVLIFQRLNIWLFVKSWKY